MTNLDQLSQAMERYAADLAPDGNGVFEAAQSIHRRRRRRTSIAAVAAVAVLVAGVPLVISRANGSSHVAPAASIAPTTAYRQPLALTVDLLPGQSAAKMIYGVYGHVQFITVRPAGNVATYGDVLVHDPGTLDTAPFLAGDKVQVHGHVAYHTTAFPVGPPGYGRPPGSPPPTGLLTDEAVGWPDPSGAWVVVTGGHSLNGLLALAENVRLGVPGRVVTPYHLGYLPPGTQVTSAQVRYGDSTLTDSVLAFGGEPPATFMESNLGWLKAPLSIQTVNRSEGVDSYQKDTPSTLKIAGHDSWWYTDREPGPLLIPQNGAALFVNAGNCQMRISVTDVRQYTFNELKRIVEGATFKDCTDGTTWVTPID
jgi:hypothetical protein